MNHIKTYLITLVLSLVIMAGNTLAQDIPAKPKPPRLVNDFTSILTQQQVSSLENMLVAFNDTTSNQIVIVMVNTFKGYDKAEFADRIGEEWGVGQGKFDNGIVILIRPKTANQSGEAWIATGYGLEGAIPDAIVNRIIDDEMIPYFRQNDYYSGLQSGSKVLMSLAAGEFSSDEYGSRTKSSPYIFFIIILILIIFSTILKQVARRTHTVGGKVPFWTALLLGSSMGRGSSSGSGWGGSSSSGGFGGFGGGSFGGGGAGGSW